MFEQVPNPLDSMLVSLDLSKVHVDRKSWEEKVFAVSRLLRAETSPHMEILRQDNWTSIGTMYNNI